MSLIRSAEDLREELLQTTGNEPEEIDDLEDPKCVCPTVEWLQRFGEVCRDRITKWKAGRPRNDATDCDDFTARAEGWSRDAFDQNRELVQAGVGCARYRARITIEDGEQVLGIPGDGHTQHKLLLFCTPEGWMLFEPQTGEHELLAVALDRCYLWAARV